MALKTMGGVIGGNQRSQNEMRFPYQFQNSKASFYLQIFSLKRKTKMCNCTVFHSERGKSTIKLFVNSTDLLWQTCE